MQHTVVRQSGYHRTKLSIVVAAAAAAADDDDDDDDDASQCDVTVGHFQHLLHTDVGFSATTKLVYDILGIFR